MNTKGHNINSNIAKITEPISVSQSDLANFVSFEAVKGNSGGGGTITLTINNTLSASAEEDIKKESTIKFINEAKDEFVFYGTKDKQRVSNSTFFIDASKPGNTAQNIRHCLLQNSFLNSNYKIEIAYKDGAFSNLITLKPLDTKQPQPLKVEKAENSSFVSLQGSIAASSNDTIFNKSDAASIELEIYTLEKNEAFLGVNKLPETSMGNYMTTLRKSYFGEPLWFNLNALMNNRSTHSDAFLAATDWCDAGTANAYRFIARRFDGKNREPFYISNVLYNITGYDRTLAENDLSPYVLKLEYDEADVLKQPAAIEPLTKQPELTHIKGQKQYFNFILSDEKHGTGNSGIKLGLQYRFYTQSKTYIGTQNAHLKDKNGLSVVNTIALDIDRMIEKVSTNKTIARVEVSLIMQSGSIVSIVSQPLSFRIIPVCLYRDKVKSFAFLNSLGGWSAFSFGGDSKSDFKASSETIFKTHTPGMESYSDLESVYSKEVKETFTVESLPINRQTVEWLRDMSASKAIYELNDDPKKSRYIIIEDMKINPNSKDELFTVEMKYRYSDSYNAR